MTGKITVLDDNGQRSNVASLELLLTIQQADTVGVLMVPAEDSQDIVQSLRTAGFRMRLYDHFQGFTNRPEDDGGDQQALLVWTTSGKTYK